MKDSEVRFNKESSSPTSSTLLDRIRRKEQEAWERLVSLYSPLVYHWCKRAGLQREDAEEVGQEVFLAVARAIAKFRHDREGDTFRGWLRTITRSKIANRRPPPGGQGAGGSDAQRQLLQVESTRAAEDSNAEAQAVENNIVYRRAVELIESAFEPATRRAFWLLIAGRKPREVAEELHMSVSAVYIAKSRILKRLRDEFSGLLDLSAPRCPRSNE